MSITEKIKGLFAPAVNTPQTTKILPDGDDDDDDDDVAYDEFVGAEEWEDQVAIAEIKAQYPPSWYLVKVTNFTEGTLGDAKRWCKDNCQNKFKQVGWTSGCSYTVGVIFEGHTDAVMFKLIWGS